MLDGADTLRERRRSETTRTLVRLTRRLTAERGLAGFTVEEVCSEAAISRRTFFNYFASKDDAVLGIPLDRSDAAAVARFLAGGDAGTHRELSPTLVADLALLHEERWKALDLTGDAVSELRAAIEAEPRLLQRLLEQARERELFDVRLIEQREQLAEGDLRADLAAHLVGALARAAMSDFLSRDTESFSVLFEQRIIAARELLLGQVAPAAALQRG
ncbi:TetR/AcrR family transcriptional regulator [Microbacterium fluvii]|uniref:TetR/AcrR family transcriptional regulator n=1 Tax=Microbacterium fluvii TaxID=415215 RepID=A0ABW2HCM1_9MICO|nr:helix-turn-helix domain-containing protein [Microbacterium fluvii]MCU4672705.1 TetR/AcrR family transcriptional regulator [Microbacterium fluvii]